MKSVVTIRLSEALRAELEEVSKQQRKSISEIVRESVRRYVAVERFRQLRGQVLPFAEAEGILTDEDVFRIVS